MSFATGYSIKQTDPPRSPRETLPTMYDLPSEFPEEPGLPDEYHDLQPQLLSRTLSLTDYSRENWFAGSDLNVYYDVHRPLKHRRPDWFLAVGVPRLYDGHDLRRSYVVWQEGQAPAVVIEFLSPSTERDDLGRFYRPQDQIPDDQSALTDGPATPPTKLDIYESYLRVPHYIVYSRYTQQLRYFKLVGRRYQEQAVEAAAPAIWIDDLHIGLGIWPGEFEDTPGHWLRWCDRNGSWMLTDTEQERQAKEQARLEKEQARLEKEQIQARLAQTARNLLATGMAVEQVAEMMAMTVEEVRTLAGKS